MGKDSKISWTHHTFNPWWGCARVSPGCENCYAEQTAARFGTSWGPSAGRRAFGEAHWAEPLSWHRAAVKSGVRRRVFCASMADLFEDRSELDQARARTFHLIEETHGLDWLILTKRPENIQRLQPTHWHARWPLNAWAGVTAEDQKRLDERLPYLLQISAPVRFLSCEPLLGPLSFRPRAHSTANMVRLMDQGLAATPADLAGIDWVIVGGESGPRARPCDLYAVRGIVSQCRVAEVPVFVKQLGAEPRGVCAWKHHDEQPPQMVDEDGTFVSVSGRGPGDLCHSSGDHWWPCQPALADRAGRDINEWPEDLRIQEFPEVKP